MKPNTPKKQPVKQSLAERFEKFTRNKYVIIILLFIVSIVFFTNYNALYDKKFLDESKVEHKFFPDGYVTLIPA